jgi:hypothetical protein
MNVGHKLREERDTEFKQLADKAVATAVEEEKKNATRQFRDLRFLLKEEFRVASVKQTEEADQKQAIALQAQAAVLAAKQTEAVLEARADEVGCPVLNRISQLPLLCA